MSLLELLSLERPLVIFDTETTGPNPATDRIVELGLIQIKPDGTVKEWQTYVNPQRPIPHEATYGNGDNYPGHGITDEMVKDAFTFAQLAPNLLLGFHDCDYGGYNIKTFDLPLIQAEFKRNGHQWSWANARLLDGYRLWQLGESRTLSDAVERFLKRKHDGAHRALDDVKASRDVIFEQLSMWPKLPRNMDELQALAYPVDPNSLPGTDNKLLWKDGEAVLNFGKKWKDMPLRKMSSRDLRWLAKDASGINDIVKAICFDAAMGKFPVRDLLN